VTLAINDNGDVLSDAGGTWKPATRAINDQTGQSLVLDGDSWKPLPGGQSAAPTASTQATTPTMSEYGPSYAAPAPGGSEAPGDATVERIGTAAANAYRATPSILAQPAQEAIDKYGGPIGQQLVNPAFRALSGVPAAANAGMAALAQSVMEVFGEKGGRDALALLSSLPAAAGERMSPEPAAPSPAPTPVEPRPQFVSERFAPDVSQLNPRDAITALINHDITENTPSVAAIGSAPDIDTAIAAAGRVADAPAPYVPVTAAQVAARDNIPILQAWMRARAENDEGLAQQAAPQTMADWLAAQRAPSAPTAGEPTATPSGMPQAVGAPGMPQAVGVAASREGTPADQIAMEPGELAANRLQGEVERLAAPPPKNDTTIYIPDTKPTLAETTGDPQVATDQRLNRQNPEAIQSHIAQENQNAELTADYFADTAGSAQQLRRLEMERDARAQQNIQNVFGDPQSQRAPADLTPTIDLMQGILNNPRQAERSAVVNTLSSLADKFYDENGDLKTDPYALYGIGEHINDLMKGVGDPETSSAARVLKMELTQIKNSLYDDIEKAAPGFAQYRSQYAQDSQAINSMQLLQDARLSLLNKDQHITPARWFTFMKGIVQGRADPMDPASSLSDDQMDRLWNITDQLKRSTFIDAGSPRGSPTSMLLKWGKNIGTYALREVPVVGNLAADAIGTKMRSRSVVKDMDRFLNPDLGQTPPQ